MLVQIRPGVSAVAAADEAEAAGKLDALIEASKSLIAKKSRAGSLSGSEKTHNKRIARFYTDAKKKIADGETIKDVYNEKITALRADVERELKRIDNLFEGMDKMFGADSNEMLVLVTELTLNADTAEFLSDFRSDSYERYNSVLKVGDRAENLKKEIDRLEELR